MIDDQRKTVDEITAAEAKATTGPWRSGRKIGRTLYSQDTLIGTLDHEVDAAFIALARTAIPFLLQLVQELGNELEGAVHRLEREGIKCCICRKLSPTRTLVPGGGFRPRFWCPQCSEIATLKQQRDDYARALVEWIRLEPGQDEPPILQKAKQHLTEAGE